MRIHLFNPCDCARRIWHIRKGHGRNIFQEREKGADNIIVGHQRNRVPGILSAPKHAQSSRFYIAKAFATRRSACEFILEVSLPLAWVLLVNFSPCKTFPRSEILFRKVRNHLKRNTRMKFSDGICEAQASLERTGPDFGDFLMCKEACGLLGFAEPPFGDVNIGDTLQATFFVPPGSPVANNENKITV